VGDLKVKEDLGPRQDEVLFIPAPRDLQDLGVGEEFVIELILKEIYFAGRTTAIEISRALAISFAIIQTILEQLKREMLVRVVGSQGPLPQLYEYSMTDQGRKKTDEMLSRCRYRGPMPVPYEQYCKIVKEQSIRYHDVPYERLKQGLSHLVLDQSVLDLLGPALKSRQCIFLYGPAGNGKTTIATSLGKIFGSPELIPYAIYVAGQVIRIFDPLFHQQMVPKEITERRQDGSSEQYQGPERRRDQRWVICHRPSVVVGGELTAEKLELPYDEDVGYHQAPLHMKANGGLLVIDDFGRQRIPPTELLNRWIVPMDRGVDYLTLNNGGTIEVPFDVLLTFATNLRPSDLIDEALLRRLPYKIPVPNPTQEEYCEIFRRAAAKKDLTIDEHLLDEFIKRHYQEARREMRNYHPIALIKYADDVRQYRAHSNELNREILDAAARALFIVD
jgi:predicted ATPase with chaperone activity